MTGVLAALVGGWQVNGIVQANSGYPLDYKVPRDTLGTSNTGSRSPGRPNIVSYDFTTDGNQVGPTDANFDWRNTVNLLNPAGRLLPRRVPRPRLLERGLLHVQGSAGALVQRRGRQDPVPRGSVQPVQPHQLHQPLGDADQRQPRQNLHARSPTARSSWVCGSSSSSLKPIVRGASSREAPFFLVRNAECSNCGLRIADCGLQIEDCRLRMEDCPPFVWFVWFVVESADCGLEACS